QHPGERGGDALLSEGEHAEWKREPDEAQQHDVPPVLARDGPAGGWDEAESDEADQDAGKGEAVGLDRLETLGDEEERCAPDEAGSKEQEPVHAVEPLGRGERGGGSRWRGGSFERGAHAMGGQDSSGSGPWTARSRAAAEAENTE